MKVTLLLLHWLENQYYASGLKICGPWWFIVQVQNCIIVRLSHAVRIPWEKAESRIHRLSEVITLKAVPLNCYGLPWSKVAQPWFILCLQHILDYFRFLGIKLSLQRRTNYRLNDFSSLVHTSHVFVLYYIFCKYNLNI